MIPVSLFLPFSPFFPLPLSFPLTLGFPFFPLAALPFPSRRVQGGAHRPFGCKAVIRSDPGSGAFWGDAHAGASSRVQLGAPGPPLPSPFPLGYPPTASRRSRWCFLGRRPCGRLQPSATRRSRSPLTFPFSPWLPADCKSALPVVLFGETPMRASPAECNSALPVPPYLPLFPLATRRLQVGAPGGAFWGDAHAGVSSRVQLGAPGPPLYLPAKCNSALPAPPWLPADYKSALPLLVVVHFAAAEVFVGVRVGYEEAFVISGEVERGGGGAEGVFAYPG